eukprot:GFUD01030519.1.p1 GENE.GFUD01030519.1~~GFUD01030519.1.p1  ORF type:complete len:199 (+),score=49.74 GFUD01030519.1:630-1226(+)
MFSKADKKKIKHSRAAARAEVGGSFRLSQVCGVEKAGERWAVRYMVRYCGQVCQVRDWSNQSAAISARETCRALSSVPRRFSRRLRNPRQQPCSTNKLEQCGLQVDELKRKLEEYDMEQIKERVVVARAALALQSRKVDLSQYTICHDSMKKQSEALSLQIAASTLARQEKLQEMTNLHHQEGSGSFMGWVGGIGLVA